MDKGVFLKGYLVAKALRMRRSSAGAGSAAAGGSGTFDKGSFLAGLAAGFCAPGAVFGDADGTAHPEYRYYFKVGKIYLYGSALMNEYGLRLVYNEGAIIAKCGIYLTRKTDSDGKTWDYITMACTGIGLTDVMATGFYALNGVTTLDGLTEGSGLNTFPMSRDSYGVWSHNGVYTLIQVNLIDQDGSPVMTTGSGNKGVNARCFTDLEEMKAWLNE